MHFHSKELRRGGLVKERKILSLKTRGRGNGKPGALSHYSFGLRWDVPLTIAVCRVPSMKKFHLEQSSWLAHQHIWTFDSSVNKKRRYPWLWKAFPKRESL